MPIEEVSQEMQELLDNLVYIRDTRTALAASYDLLELDEENTLQELQSICLHTTAIGYGAYMAEGIEYPEFKCCAICEKVL